MGLKLCVAKPGKSSCCRDAPGGSRTGGGNWWADAIRDVISYFSLIRSSLCAAPAAWSVTLGRVYLRCKTSKEPVTPGPGQAGESWAQTALGDWRQRGRDQEQRAQKWSGGENLPKGATLHHHLTAGASAFHWLKEMCFCMCLSARRGCLQGRRADAGAFPPWQDTRRLPLCSPAPCSANTSLAGCSVAPCAALLPHPWWFCSPRPWAELQGDPLGVPLRDAEDGVAANSPGCAQFSLQVWAMTL